MRVSLSNWHWVKLASVAAPTPNSFVDGPFGSDLKCAEYTTEGIRLIQLQNIGDGYWVDESKKYISERKATELSRHVAYPGDVAIAKMAEPVARACLLPKVAEKFLVVADCIKLSPDPFQYDARYVVHALNHHSIRRQAQQKSIGTTRQRINLSKLKTIEILTPPLVEQKRVADMLDTIDSAIAETQVLIGKLGTMRTGLLHDLLARGIDENGQLRDPIIHPEQFVDSGVGPIPSTWKVESLSTVANVDRGKFAQRPRNDPRFYGGPYPFIQTGDIADAGGGLLDFGSQTLNERGADVSREFPRNTIAVTIAANIGETAILGRPMFFPDSVVGVVVRPPHNVRYVELCLRSAKLRLQAVAPQSAQKNINLDHLRPLQLAVPEPPEQDRIAAVYDVADERISAEEVWLGKLKAIKKGLMQDLLTGRVRVMDSKVADSTLVAARGGE